MKTKKYGTSAASAPKSWLFGMVAALAWVPLGCSGESPSDPKATTPASPAPPQGSSITRFTSTPGYGDVPFHASFTWELARDVEAGATCALDADGDGEADQTLTPCPTSGVVSHTFSVPGEYLPSLSVQQPTRGKVNVATRVFANDLELRENVIFPERLVGVTRTHFDKDRLIVQRIPGSPQVAMNVGSVVVGLAEGQPYSAWITAVEEGQDTVWLTLQPASLEHIIKRGYFGATVDLGAVGEGCAGCGGPSTQAIVPSQWPGLSPQGLFEPTDPIEATDRISFDLPLQKSGEQLSIGPATIEDTRLKGNLSATLKIDCPVGLLYCKHFGLGVDYLLRLETKADLQLIEESLPPVKLGQVPLAQLMIGPVPVAVGFEPELTLEATGSVKLQLGVGQKGGVWVGKDAPIVRFQSPSIDNPVVKLDADGPIEAEWKLSFSPYVTLKLGSTFTGLGVKAGPSEYISVKLAGPGPKGELGCGDAVFGGEVIVDTAMPDLLKKFIPDVKQTVPIAEVPIWHQCVTTDCASYANCGPGLHPEVVPSTLHTRPGADINVEGRGFSPQGTAELHVQSPVGAANVRALPLDSKGAFVTSETIPSGAVAGSYGIWAIDTATGTKSAPALFTVECTPPTQEQACSMVGSTTCGYMQVDSCGLKQTLVCDRCGGDVCNLVTQACEKPCQPYCVGKPCGAPDGCGSNCPGSCPPGSGCFQGQCASLSTTPKLSGVLLKENVDAEWTLTCSLGPAGANHKTAFFVKRKGVSSHLATTQVQANDKGVAVWKARPDATWAGQIEVQCRDEVAPGQPTSTWQPSCISHTCPSLGYQCGAAQDGCGGSLACGACAGATAKCVDETTLGA